MKIKKRLVDGWTDKVFNKDKKVCDTCGSKLWIGPGRIIYCDNVHKE